MELSSQIESRKEVFAPSYKTVRVSELKAGDELSNCVVLASPVFIGDYCGSKNRMAINVRFANGQESTRIWGKTTTVKIKVTNL